MGQSTADKITLRRICKAMDEFNSFYRTVSGQAFIPGHYYKGIGGVVIKVVGRTKSGKTVYITTHSDDDNPCLQTKRVKIGVDGEEYITYKDGHHVIGVWHETDREAFRNYINANIGNPVAVIQ